MNPTMSTPRRFRHPDGRVWSMRPHRSALTLHLRLPGDPDPVHRTRTYATEEGCAAAAGALLAEQIADGFVEDMVAAAFGRSRTGRDRGDCLDRFLVEEDLGLFMVVDGFEHPFAPEQVVACVRAAVLASPGDISGALQRGIEEADRVVAAEARSDRAMRGATLEDRVRRGMGASVVAMLASGAEATLVWLPHDRAYVIRGDDLELLTPDDWSHPPDPWPLQAASEDDWPLPERVQLVGSGGVRVTERRIALCEGERWLLCSDGLHREHDTDELRACVLRADAESRTGRADPEELVSRLLSFSPAADDRTVVCVAARCAPPRAESPKTLLSAVEWTFSVPGDGRPIDPMSRAELERRLNAARPAARATRHTIVLAYPEVHVVFEPWRPERRDRVPTRLTLSAPSSEGFTEVDLMIALHGAVVESLRASGGTLGDHCFLEGLQLAGHDRGVPVYWMTLGS